MPDPQRREALAWLHRASDDLGAAAKLLSGNDPFPATAAYHCQQAAEKALKAMIASTGEIHDLRVLLARCIGTDQSLDALCDACDELTPYSAEFRYPGEDPDPSLDQAQSALVLSNTVGA